MSNERILSTDREAQAALKISRNTLLKLADRAGAVYHFGRAVRFDVPKILEFAERERSVEWDSKNETP